MVDLLVLRVEQVVDPSLERDAAANVRRYRLHKREIHLRVTGQPSRATAGNGTKSRSARSPTNVATSVEPRAVRDILRAGGNISSTRSSDGGSAVISGTYDAPVVESNPDLRSCVSPCRCSFLFSVLPRHATGLVRGLRVPTPFALAAGNVQAVWRAERRTAVVVDDIVELLQKPGRLQRQLAVVEEHVDAELRAARMLRLKVRISEHESSRVIVQRNSAR